MGTITVLTVKTEPSRFALSLSKKTIGIALALIWGLATTLRAQDIYVAKYNSGTIGEYTISGQTVNASLISGLIDPTGITISGDNLFVPSYSSSLCEWVIGEYTTSGTTVNAAVITGLPEASGVVITPEPSTVALAGLGAAAFCVWRRRRDGH